MAITATDLHAMLTPRELDVLAVLCNSPVPLTASGIVDASDGLLKTNTVQAILRTLLKDGLVEVADIVYSGTVLCRSYQLTEKANERITQQLAYQFSRLGPDFTLVDAAKIMLEAAEKAGRKEIVLAEMKQFVADEMERRRIAREKGEWNDEAEENEDA